MDAWCAVLLVAVYVLWWVEAERLRKLRWRSREVCRLYEGLASMRRMAEAERSEWAAHEAEKLEDEIEATKERAGLS